MDGGRAGWGLEGHGIIVTGAAQGIGAATARAFADVGAHVTAVDLKTEAVETVVAALPGGPHKAVGMDLNDLAAHAPLIAESAAEFGDVVGIVLAAGVLKREAFTEVTEEAWDWQVDTNLKATFFLSRAAGEYFRAAGIKGSITTFTSISAVTGGVSPAPAYGASKGGVITVTYRPGTAVRTGRHPRQHHLPGFHRHADAAVGLLGRDASRRRCHPHEAYGRPRGGRLGGRVPGLESRLLRERCAHERQRRRLHGLASLGGLASRSTALSPPRLDRRVCLSLRLSQVIPWPKHGQVVICDAADLEQRVAQVDAPLLGRDCGGVDDIVRVFATKLGRQLEHVGLGQRAALFQPEVAASCARGSTLRPATTRAAIRRLPAVSTAT